MGPSRKEKDKKGKKNVKKDGQKSECDGNIRVSVLVQDTYTSIFERYSSYSS